MRRQQRSWAFKLPTSVKLTFERVNISRSEPALLKYTTAFLPEIACFLSEQGWAICICDTQLAWISRTGFEGHVPGQLAKTVNGAATNEKATVRQQCLSVNKYRSTVCLCDPRQVLRDLVGIQEPKFGRVCAYALCAIIPLGGQQFQRKRRDKCLRQL